MTDQIALAATEDIVLSLWALVVAVLGVVIFTSRIVIELGRIADKLKKK